MKKRLCMLLMFCFLFAGCLDALAAESHDPLMDAILTEPGADDLTYEAALEFARPVWKNAVGITDESDRETLVAYGSLLTLELDGKTEKAWWMVLHDRHGERQTCGVLILSPSGEVSGVDTFKGYDRALSWVAELGPRFGWMPKEQELFHHLYEEPFETNVIAQPGPGDMTRDEAIALATAVWVEQEGVDPASFEGLTLGATFYRLKADDPERNGDQNTDTWSVFYYTPSRDMTSFDTTMYYVTLDARTGAPLYVFNGDVDGPSHG